MEKLTGRPAHRPQFLIFYVPVLSMKVPGWSPPRGRGIFREGRPPSSSRDARIGHGPEIEGLEPEREAGLEVTTLSGGGKPHGGAVSTRAVPPFTSQVALRCLVRVQSHARWRTSGGSAGRMLTCSASNSQRRSSLVAEPSDELRHLPAQDLREYCRVDVAAGDDAHDRSRTGLTAQCSGDRCTGSAFGNDMIAHRHEPDRLGGLCQ